MKILLIVIAVLALFSSCAQMQDFYIKTRCIGGHVYYVNNGYCAGGIAPKLNDDGTPCKCQPKENY